MKNLSDSFTKFIKFHLENPCGSSKDFFYFGDPFLTSDLNSFLTLTGEKSCIILFLIDVIFQEVSEAEL